MTYYLFFEDSGRITCNWRHYPALHFTSTVLQKRTFGIIPSHRLVLNCSQMNECGFSGRQVCEDWEKTTTTCGHDHAHWAHICSVEYKNFKLFKCPGMKVCTNQYHVNLRVTVSRPRLWHEDDNVWNYNNTRRLKLPPSINAQFPAKLYSSVRSPIKGLKRYCPYQTCTCIQLWCIDRVLWLWKVTVHVELI